jgi:hypothetical protein
MLHYYYIYISKILVIEKMERAINRENPYSIPPQFLELEDNYHEKEKLMVLYSVNLNFRGDSKLL